MQHVEYRTAEREQQTASVSLPWIVIIIIALLIGWFINEMGKAQRKTSDAIQYGR
jgi:hypothetical protein